MPSSTNDPVELVDDARKQGSEPVGSSSIDSHCSKKPRTGTALQQKPVVTSSKPSQNRLYTYSGGEATKFPKGVVNVFPDNINQSRCCCPTQPQRTTLASCDVAQIFVSQYGADNLAYLQETERQEYPAKTRTSDRASKTSAAQTMLLSFAQTSNEDGIASELAGYVSPSSGGVSDANFLPPSAVVANAMFLENPSDYLPRQPWVTTRMRAVIVSWLVEVTVDLNISDEAFHVAVSILDRVFRSGAAAEQYQANPDYDWDADYFCVRISELQALGWYVFAFEGQGVSSCQVWVFC
jgi:hypothetical protein